MDINPLDTHSLQVRTENLRRQAKQLTPREQLLTHALEELNTSLEELRVAEEELRVQNEALTEMAVALEQQAERYRDLFEHLPEAYLVTDAAGHIREANRAAQEMLNAGGRRLMGRMLTQFVAAEDQSRFHDLFRAGPDVTAREHVVRLQARQGKFQASLSVSAARDAQKQIVSLRWRLRETSAQMPDESADIVPRKTTVRQQMESQ